MGHRGALTHVRRKDGDEGVALKLERGRQHVHPGAVEVVQRRQVWPVVDHARPTPPVLHRRVRCKLVLTALAPHRGAHGGGGFVDSLEVLAAKLSPAGNGAASHQAHGTPDHRRALMRVRVRAWAAGARGVHLHHRDRCSLPRLSRTLPHPLGACAHTQPLTSTCSR